jgi:cytoskeleton protein RodZ
MAQKPFGRILAEARERKGMDINYVSQKLRIRADILRAIEQNDFSRMPARGYTRNMVNAYARLLGLNATSVTRQYLDEADRYIHSSHSYGSSSRSASRQGRDGSRGTSRSSSGSYNRDFARTLNSNGGGAM